jgi:hypothetical protein
MSRSYPSVRRIVHSLAWLALVFAGMQTSAVRGHASGPPAAVRGVAWNSDNSTIPYAKVRLRNTHSGRVEANAVTGEDGQFTFSPVEGGPYVVELLGENGRVIAVGPSFQAEPGETAATFVKLAPRRPWLAAVLSNAAIGVIAAASHAGVTAMGPTGSGSRPISPQ